MSNVSGDVVAGAVKTPPQTNPGKPSLLSRLKKKLPWFKKSKKKDLEIYPLF